MRQKRQRGQRVIKEINPHALREKHLERVFCQLRIFSTAIQGQPDRFPSQSAHVVAQVGATFDDFFAHRYTGLGVRKHTGGHRRPLRQPGRQRGLSALNGGPYRPQGVIEIERNCPDF